MAFVLDFLSTCVKSLSRNNDNFADVVSLGYVATEADDLEDTFHVFEGFFFIGCVWLFGRVFGMIHAGMIGEIIAGFLLGPQGTCACNIYADICLHQCNYVCMSVHVSVCVCINAYICVCV